MLFTIRNKHKFLLILLYCGVGLLIAARGFKSEGFHLLGNMSLGLSLAMSIYTILVVLEDLLQTWKYR